MNSRTVYAKFAHAVTDLVIKTTVSKHKRFLNIKQAIYSKQS